MKKIFSALAFAFVFVTSGIALAQPGGNAPAGNGNGDPNVCEEIAKCPKEEPKPAPPPQYRCGEGTVEEGTTLVGKMCTCKSPKTFPVPDLGHYGTIICAIGADLLDEYDALVIRVNVQGQTIDELKKNQETLLIFKAAIEELNLPLFVEMVNRELANIDVRLDALEKDVADLKAGQKATNERVDHLAKSVVQLTIGVEGGGNVRTANGEDENGTGSFTSGGGYFVGTLGLQGYFTEVFGLGAKLKAGLTAGSETGGIAGEVGGTLGAALRFDPVYLNFGPAWYLLASSHHTDAGGEGNFRGWGMGGEADIGVRPIPQLEVGLSLFVGGGHNGSAIHPVEGPGVWAQGGLYLQGVLGVIDESDEPKSSSK